MNLIATIVAMARLPIPKIDPVRFYADLQNCKDVASCARLFKQALKPFGLDTYAYGEVDLANRDRIVFYILEWPERFRKFYIATGLIEQDPLLDAVRIWQKPFTWSELRADRALSNFTRETLQHLAENSWTEGLVVPVARGGTRYGVVSIIGNSKPITAKQRTELCLITTCLMVRVRSLAADSGYPLSPAGLSPREVDAVTLVARGLSDPAIGKRLGISASTAHHHIEGARRKLHAKTRAELAAVSMSLGIIDG
jgi:LuxR family transcriptional regulator, quorum-sensing system regulator BjaR1